MNKYLESAYYILRSLEGSEEEQNKIQTLKKLVLFIMLEVGGRGLFLNYTHTYMVSTARAITGHPGSHD